MAVAFAIRAAIGATFQRSSYVFPDPLPFHDVGRAGFVHLGGAQVQARAFFVIGLAVALALGSAWFLERSRYGRGLPAVAEDDAGERFVGVPISCWSRFCVRARQGAGDDRRGSGRIGTSTRTRHAAGLKGLVAALTMRFGPPLRALSRDCCSACFEAAIANVHLGGSQVRPLVPRGASRSRSSSS